MATSTENSYEFLRFIPYGSNFAAIRSKLPLCSKGFLRVTLDFCYAKDSQV